MKMSIIFCLLILSILICCSNRMPESTKGNNEKTSSMKATIDSCVDFNSLNTKIRDGKISKQEALAEVQKIIPQLKNYFYKNGGKDLKRSDWIFPINKYDAKNIGGTNGSGYIPSGYEYFNGNNHGGHPAHDIFINDKDENTIDDFTGKPIKVLAMTEGIVIATEDNWDTTSDLKGGKYIWIYTPSVNSFFYYAHNKQLFVKPCDIVKPGDSIAYIGRTGKQAFEKRSPTHLHIMQLKLDSIYYPKPVNCYQSLIIARTNQ